MISRPPIRESESQAREALVELAKAMLAKDVSYFEGAVEVLELKSKIGGIGDCDPDFDAFLAVVTETDHLPLKAQQHLWSQEAVAALKSEFERVEAWAALFASIACRSLIARFEVARTDGLVSQKDGAKDA